MHSRRVIDAPVANAAFIPSSDSGAGAPFAGVIEVAQTAMRTLPILDHPIIDGRDARLFPGVKLGFFSMGDILVPVEHGEMVQESPQPSRRAIGG